MLDMPKMRVLEIASFYSMFNLTPTGDNFIQVCGTTPCWLRGSDEIKKACQDMVGNEGEVSNDGISWLEVECLGACVNAPAVQINEDYYEDLDYENMRLLINNIKDKKGMKIGSQTGRVSSEPKKTEESDA
jgi:NADH-quinone oxidoreductase subunit E